MTTIVEERNKKVVIDFWDAVIKQKERKHVDPQVFKQFVSDEYVEHQDIGQGPGYEGLMERFRWIIRAFPDFEIDLKYVVAEGDIVVCHYEDRGTFKGEFMGLQPTGKPYVMEGVHFFRLKDAKITEHWAIVTELQLFFQMGVIDQVVAAMRAQAAE